MRRAIAAAIFLGVPVVVLAVACGTPEPVEVTGAFFLPVGDAAAGREAFIEMRCHYCHLVVGDDEMPDLVGDTKGPDISPRQAGQGRDRIAMSIVAPGHEMPPLMRQPQSPMGDYKDVMTIRQLMDLVTFVGSQD